MDPEIGFVNSFRGPLKKCTNRRAYKPAMHHYFLIFHAVEAFKGQRKRIEQLEPVPKAYRK
jgi:hypothetical protein